MDRERRRGADLARPSDRTTRHSSPVGTLTLVAGDAGLAAILWPREITDHPDDTHPILDETRRQLDAYFAGTLTRFDLPLDPRGTPFQRRMWDALAAIPFGETRSYRAIARRLGQPNATRAVGAAKAATRCRSCCRATG